MKKLAGIFQALKTKTFDSIRLSPKIVRKPKLFFYWLISARWAQIALLLVVIGLPNFIPIIVDAQLEKLYPPIIEKKFLGLVKQAKPNPQFENRRKASIIALWSGSGAIVIFLLVLHIPHAISKTTAMARKRVNEADALADSKPLSSIIAQKLTQNPVPLSGLNGDVPKRLKHLVIQMLAKEPHRRPENMNQVADVLRSVSGRLAA